MKKLYIVCCLVFVNLIVFSQNYKISFTGIGDTTEIESILIRNLTQNTSLTIAGTDTLHLVSVITSTENREICNTKPLIYPNPSSEICNITFQTPINDYCLLEIFDSQGKSVYTGKSFLEQGEQSITIRGLSSGEFFFRALSPSYEYQGSILSVNPLKYSSVSVQFQTQAISRPLKSSKNTVQMQYNTGNQLLIKSFSGKYATLVPLKPTEDTELTVQFTASDDGDDNHYSTVQIGGQLWMADNLRTTKYTNGASIPLTTNETDWYNGTSPKYCWFNNDYDTYGFIYGALYNWYALDTASNGKKYVCPVGWRLPTDADWTELTSFLGGESYAGGKMKETGTAFWLAPNTGATNTSGFSAYGGGYRTIQGVFSYLLNQGCWWSSTAGSDTYAWYRLLIFGGGNVSRTSTFKRAGNSVRCLKG